MMHRSLYVPWYDSGSSLMKMLRITSLDDYDQLPMTSWNIKQPASENISLMVVVIDCIM